MFIAHLPAGYILTKVMPIKSKSVALWATGLFFAVAPDFDLFYFYLFSARKIPHHAYVTHWPLLWIALAAAVFIVSLPLHKRSWRPFIVVGLATVLLHLALDSIAAEIYWLAPFSDKYVNLVEVPANYSWWVYSFILHWTFALELIICIAAIALLIFSYKKKKVAAPACLSNAEFLKYETIGLG